MKFVPVPGTKVLFSVWTTRVADYEAYAAANPKADGSWKKQEKDGVPVGREQDHPVVGVSWEDAQAFCQWLTEKDAAGGRLPKGAKYRLPTDEEWSIAVGLPPEMSGTPSEKHGKNQMDYPWGREWPPRGKVGNYADESFQAKFPVKWNEEVNREENLWLKDYTDCYPTTSPVGSFQANLHGLYDMGGNVWQFCEDWWDSKQKERVLRGASWIAPGNLQSSSRNHYPPTLSNHYYGFRYVLSLSEPQ